MNNTIIRESAGMAGAYSFYIKTIRGYKKQIGWIDRDGVFKKEVNVSHVFYQAKALGLDYGLLEHLRDANCQRIILKDEEKIYSVSYRTFIDKGFKYPTDSSEKAKGKFQPQWMLQFKFWKVTTRGGELIQEEYSEPTEENDQLALDLTNGQ